MVQTVQSPLTIADYCAAMDRHEIAPNAEYQRSDKVWPPSARSFLIETILLGYPLPKIFLFQKTDLKSKKTIKEIVDGQQRSKTIHDFFHNKLVLSRDSEIDLARGRTYDQLDDELKGRFLNYSLSIDLFVSAAPMQIRQAFRRLNSYTVPLNPEELRHAEYQGAFKWFIYKVTTETEEQLLQLGALTEKQIVRMQDTKLFAECVHALLYGIKTTKAKDLDDLYRDFEREFPEEGRIKARIDAAMSAIVEMEDIHDGPLMKPHVLYTLILALTHVAAPIESLRPTFDPDLAIVRDEAIALTNLTALAEALALDAPEERFKPFVDASSSKTNVESQRRIRFQWLCKALFPTLL